MANLLFDNEIIRAIIGGMLLIIAAAPLGAFLIIRRMSLVSDALGHSILPGAALGALLFHSNNYAMTIGAAITGMALFFSASRISKLFKLPEDTVFAIFYLGALSIGLLFADIGHESIEELLFGDLLKIDNFTLGLCLLTAIISSITMYFIYKPLLIDTLEPDFYPKIKSIIYAKSIFYILLALVGVAAFKAVGTLLAVGLMIAPAAAAFSSKYNIKTQILLADFIGFIALIIGACFAQKFGLNASAVIVFILVVFVFFTHLLNQKKT